MNRDPPSFCRGTGHTLLSRAATMKTITSCIPLLALILILLASTGCMEIDYVANRDIILIRLHPDGTKDWTKLFDTGYDDSASDLIETSGGGYLLAAQNTSGRYGPSHPRLIRLSTNGTILWVQTFSNSDGEPTSVVQTRDGGYATVTRDGNVVRFSPGGNLLRITRTGITDALAVLETADGGIAIAGVQQDSIPFGSVPVYDEDGRVTARAPLPNETVVTPGCHETLIPAGDRQIPVTECTVPVDLIRQGVVVKLDGGGNVSWQKSYGASGMNSAWSMTEASDGRGFFIAGYETAREDAQNITSTIVVLRADRDGKALRTTRLDRIEYFISPLLREMPGGYEILSVNTTLDRSGSYVHRPIEVQVDLHGNVTKSRLLDTGVVVTWTRDGGYFSAGFPSGGDNAGYGDAIQGRPDAARLHAVLLHPDGSRAWDREIPDVAVNDVIKVLQTSDGGYIILAIRENY